MGLVKEKIKGVRKKNDEVYLKVKGKELKRGIVHLS